MKTRLGNRWGLWLGNINKQHHQKIRNKKEPKEYRESTMGTTSSTWQLSHMEICWRLDLTKKELPSSTAERQHACTGLSKVRMNASWEHPGETRLCKVEGGGPSLCHPTFAPGYCLKLKYASHKAGFGSFKTWKNINFKCVEHVFSNIRNTNFR